MVRYLSLNKMHQMWGNLWFFVVVFLYEGSYGPSGQG